MKKVFLITPSFSRNGGIRVILEWANRLSDTYKVYLRCLNNDAVPTWFKLVPQVSVVRTDTFLPHCQLLVITSPHSISYAKMYKGKKVIFLQMMEHLFQPRNVAWQSLCLQTYQSQVPMISISKWNMEMMATQFGRTAPTYYVGNGVNLEHFPVTYEKKEENCILVEGWICHNQSKDKDHVGPLAAKRLREEFGCKIITYSAHPVGGPYKHIPDEYFLSPSLEVMNLLYSRAKIMLKASKYDARSCAPMEAMTKGTVTARAIITGDDDLTHNQNCLRSEYNEYRLYQAGKQLLSDNSLRERLAHNARFYVQHFSWNHWMKQIKHILESL